MKKLIDINSQEFADTCGKIKRGADKHYPLMKTKEIINMAEFIKSISNENCHLYLWVTNNFLPDGLKVMNSWGFRYITKIDWVKEGRMGLGQYYRGCSESCLFGIKGKLPYKIIDGKRQQGRTGFVAPKSEHSEKPEFMRQQIEKVSYPPFVEIFARPKENNNLVFEENKIDEWYYIGNQADGTIF